MNRLLAQLRDMTRVDASDATTSGKLGDMRPDEGDLAIVLEAEPETIVPFSLVHGRVIFQHMAANAVDQGAARRMISYQDGVLHVSDDGVGIDAKISARLTEPLFTTRRDQGGTGMGLAIVAAILDRYGTALKVIEKPNGARFRIDFKRN